MRDLEDRILKQFHQLRLGHVALIDVLLGLSSFGVFDEEGEIDQVHNYRHCTPANQEYRLVLGEPDLTQNVITGFIFPVDANSQNQKKNR